MFPLEFANLLSQCTLVVDNARSHSESATESAEQLPPLCSYKSKSKRKTKRSRGAVYGYQQSNTTRGDRWTAESATVQPFYLRSIAAPSVRPNSTTNTAPLNVFKDVDLSPRLVAPRRVPSSDEMDIMCSLKLTDSPKRPSRKKSTISLLTDFSPRIIDFSPRKPERQMLSSKKSECLLSTKTAHMLREALALCDLCHDDDDGDSDASTAESSNFTASHNGESPSSSATGASSSGGQHWTSVPF